MTNKKITMLITAMLGIFALYACNTAPTEAPGANSEVPLVVDDFAVVAEGRLVPNESVQLAFPVGGEVVEILTARGDVVQAGDIIARLGDREQLEAAVAGAQLELASANADLLAARQNLESIHENWPNAATAAQQALTNARQRQYDASRSLGYLVGEADQTDIDLAYTQMILAKDAYDNAKDDFDPYENKPADNLVRAALQQKMAQAQKNYDAAVRRYNALVDTSNEFDISQGEAELAIANAQLEQSQKDYNELITGPDPDEVALAEARIAAAEARTATADANLAAAQASLANRDLKAPIKGTIVELNLIIGERVSPGAPVVIIADFSSWYVETDNLTEIEVVDIGIGQAVTIVADALPDLEFNGTVESIGDVFEEKRGDITYTAEILLSEIDPRLRWGMTVVVTFEK